MIDRISTERYVFEKGECFIKVSDQLYAVCYAFAIIKRDTQRLIRKASYLLEHTAEYTSFDCVDKSCPSFEKLLEISASEYFLYIDFISQNSFKNPHYGMIVSAEKDDFCTVFEQNMKS